MVVVTGHYLHDGLRHRMADADADFFFLRSDLRSPADLVDVIVNPERYRRGVAPVADIEGARALGLDRGADVERFVAYVEGQGPGRPARPVRAPARPPLPPLATVTDGPWPKPAPSRR